MLIGVVGEAQQFGQGAGDTTATDQLDADAAQLRVRFVRERDDGGVHVLSGKTGERRERGLGHLGLARAGEPGQDRHSVGAAHLRQRADRGDTRFRRAAARDGKYRRRGCSVATVAEHFDQQRLFLDREFGEFGGERLRDFHAGQFAADAQRHAELCNVGTLKIFEQQWHARRAAREDRAARCRHLNVTRHLRRADGIIECDSLVGHTLGAAQQRLGGGGIFPERGLQRGDGRLRADLAERHRGGSAQCETICSRQSTGTIRTSHAYRAGSAKAGWSR